MPRFAANLSLMFTELPFPDRFAAAAAAGFQGVEFLFPYAFDKAMLADARAAAGVTQVLFNLPPGDWDAGERGIACLPGRVGEFQDGVGLALDHAAALGCERLHCMAGIPPDTVARSVAIRTLVDNVRFAATAAGERGITIMVEPINGYDIPGYLLNRSADGIDLLDRVAMDNVRLQYDVYHMQRTEGELAATIERLLPRIGHVQVADNPGRHEPGTGEIGYAFLFDHLDRLGYAGWVGCEYRPAGDTVAGLGWAKRWLGR